MKSPLVINIRCTCIEEYLNIQKLHKEYIRQSKEGQITSVYVGADFAVPGEFEAIDALIAKREPRQIPCVDFGGKKIEITDIRSITKKFTKEDFEELKKEVDERSSVVGERITGAQGNGDGTVTEIVERIVVPQAVDGGIDAMGNPPLPEKNPATEPTHFAGESESEEKSSISEFAIGDRAEEFHYKDKAKPEITLTDVLTAMAEEPDPIEAIKTEAEGEPDGADYNTSAGC